MPLGPATAPLALLLLATQLLLAGRAVGLQALSSEGAQGSFLGVAGPSDVDTTDSEECHKGRLIAPSKRYSDRAERLASLRENCRPCFMNRLDAPLLFIKEGNEGMGSRVQELISAMAVAARNGMNFGGVLSRGVCHKAHGASVVRATSALVRLPHINDLFVEDPPVFDAVYRGVKNLEENFARGADSRGPDFKEGAYVFVQNRCISCELDGAPWSLDEYWAYWNPEFLGALRQSAVGLLSLPLVFAPSRPRVALHVRRGDVSAADQRRHTPDWWYHAFVERIRRTLPAADVHVFSSLEGRHDQAEFDEYRSRGVTVHLDDAELERDWAQLARADVLVMAKSSFSHVPAMLNQGCVIYEEYWHRPLKDWIVVGAGTNGGQTVDQEKLEACLQRVHARYSR